MDNQEALNTLSDIRKMMERSSRFMSLNGVSAIVIGLYSCLAAIIAYYILGGAGTARTFLPEGFRMPVLQIDTPARMQLLLVFAAVLVGISILTVVLMCRHKALKAHRPFGFDRITKRLLWNFFLPLAVGGILCLSLLYRHHYGMTSSVMLIFYGIALINASNYTYSNTRYLGYAELALGLADSFVEGHALLFWTIGFGLFHIVYGLWFYFKFEKQPESAA